MYSLKINGQAFDNVPQSINDVSIGRFIEFRNINHANPLMVVNWALGRDVELIDTPEVEQELTGLFALLEPTIKAIYDFMLSDLKYQTPKSVEVLGKKIKIKDGLLNELPYWPYVHCKTIEAEERAKDPYDPTDRYPEVISQYLYAAATGLKYDEEQATNFVEVINDLPMIPCIQLGNFFFRKLSGSKKLKFPHSSRSLMRILRPRAWKSLFRTEI